MIPGDTVVVDGELSLLSEIDGEIDLIIPIDGEVGIITKVTEYDIPPYTGRVVVTPSEDTQILQTAEKSVAQDIIVNPIPANYGRIVWDGSRLRIL